MRPLRERGPALAGGDLVPQVDGKRQLRCNGLAELVGEELVVSPQAVPRPRGEGWHGVGSGFGAYAEEMGKVLGTALAGLDPAQTCEAGDIARLAEGAWHRGQAVAPELALPVYLRDQVTAR